MESIWELQKLYKSSSPVPSALAYHLNQASASIASVLQNLCKKYHHCLGETERRLSPSNPTTDDKLGSIFRAVARTYSSVIFGIARLRSIGCDRAVRASVVHDTVHMYDIVFGLLTESTARLLPSSTMSSNKGRATRKSRNNANVSKDESIASALTNFLKAAVSALDSNSPSHRELFEGFMFVLLDRLGKRLYLLTFGKPRAQTIEEDLACDDTLHHDDARKLAQTEAPYLINILERAMPVGSQHLNDPSEVALSKTAKWKPSRKPTKASKAGCSIGRSLLSSIAKDRLQQTLVNAVFGPQSDGDEVFDDYLRMPTETPTPVPRPKEEEQDIPTWYTKELWAMLGWDILKEKNDWY